MLPALQKIRLFAAIGPVEQLHRVQHRTIVPDAICVMQPMLPVAITSGATDFDVPDLSVAQPRGDLRLQDVVGAGGAAADVALRNVAHLEAGVLQKRLRQRRDPLAVLQRAGGMIGDDEVGAALAGGRSSLGEIFGDVERKRRDARRLLRVGRGRGGTVAVILDRRAAAGCR